MHASERYLLDEMSQDERDQFEEHYFSCVECADEVRAVFAFADNAKDFATAGWAKGLYLLRITLPDGSITTEKISIQ